MVRRKPGALLPLEISLLEVAVAGQAACLVTGNRVHFPAKRCQGVRVLSPSDFLAFYRKQQRNQ